MREVLYCNECGQRLNLYVVGVCTRCHFDLTGEDEASRREPEAPPRVDGRPNDAQPQDDGWVYTEEPATPLYIGPLPHNARRMLQALDGYWRCHDGHPGRRGRYDLEDWWTRFERYRAKVEADL